MNRFKLLTKKLESLKVKNKELEDTKNKFDLEIFNLQKKLSQAEKTIKDLKSEISNAISHAESRHKAFRRASENGWELQDKLNKIPKWIQKFFIK